MRLFLALQFDDQMNKALMGVMHDLKKRGIQVPKIDCTVNAAVLMKSEFKDGKPVYKPVLKLF